MGWFAASKNHRTGKSKITSFRNNDTTRLLHPFPRISLSPSNIKNNKNSANTGNDLFRIFLPHDTNP